MDDYLHGDMIGTLRMTTIGSGPNVGDPGLPRVFTAFGEKITGPQDRNGYAGAWGYQAHDIAGANSYDFLHVGARYYDPSTGRFLQRDPIGIRGGTDVYEYVFNMPTVGVDPDGRFIVSGTALIIAGAIFILSTPKAVEAPSPDDDPVMMRKRHDDYEDDDIGAALLIICAPLIAAAHDALPPTVQFIGRFVP